MCEKEMNIKISKCKLCVDEKYCMSRGYLKLFGASGAKYKINEKKKKNMNKKKNWKFINMYTWICIYRHTKMQLNFDEEN